MQGLKEAKRSILKARNIAILGHTNPDGDSLGSLLSLGLGLKSIDKRIYLLSQDDLPLNYTSLPAADQIRKELRKNLDLAIAVDCSTKEMLGKNISVFKRAKVKLVIDHHRFGKIFGDTRFIDHKASATGELIYILLKDLRIKITKDIAENILTSIIAETDSFKLPNIRPFTFSLCSELLKKGVNFPRLIDRIYGTKSKESVILSGICLARCRFLKDGQIVWSLIKGKDFSSVKGKHYDIDLAINQMRSIEKVKIVVLFREKDRKSLRVSLRSKGEINVASIAERYNGGGHFDMAGCYIPNSKKSIREFLSLVEGFLK